MRSLIDNWDFALFGHGTKIPFRGYISSIDPTTAGAGVLIGGSQNTHKTLLGTVRVRDGLKRRGVANTTIAGVTSSYEWETSLGATRVLRVTEENKLQVESEIADGSTLQWYDLMTGLDSTRFIFEAWWNDSLKKDVLIFVKADANLYSWQGGIAKIVSTGGSGPASYTITLNQNAATAGFSTGGGDILINGNTYTYTAISTTTLTGVTSDPSGEAANSVVLSKVKTDSPGELAGFSNDFIKNINNQIYVGSYNAHLAYVSAFDDFTEFTVPTPRVPGDADFLIFDSELRGITFQKGSTAQAGNAVISGGLGDWYTVIRSQITVGTNLTEQVQIVRSKTSDLAAALAHEFIDVVGDNIIFLDQNNQLREFGLVRNIVNPVYPLLSLDVFTELKNRDFSGGHLRAVSEDGDTTIHITAPEDGVDYLYQIRQKIDDVGNLGAERLWHPPQVRGIARIAVIDGVTFGHSNANPQLYQVWNTGQYSDDSPSDTPLPYECHAIFAYLSLQNRTQQMYFDKIFFEGYMSTGTTLYNNVYQEYQGSKNILTVTVNKPTDPGKKLAKFFNSQKTPSLGDVSLGEVPLGEGVLAVGGTNPPKFRAMRNVQPAELFESAFDLFSVDLDSQWEILCMGANIQSTPGNAAFLLG